jgi:hypothetical protein
MYNVPEIFKRFQKILEISKKLYKVIGSRFKKVQKDKVSEGKKIL